MAAHPFRDVVIAGIHNTEQARHLDGDSSLTLTVKAGMGALGDAGMTPLDVDAVIGPLAADFVYQTRIGPVWRSGSLGIGAVLEAAALVATGLASVALVVDGGFVTTRSPDKTAVWTRPEHELTAPYGMFTAAEFALVARRHMHRYGTTAESMATVAATIRTNGHVNPEAVYFNRGPVTVRDVLDSRMVADPFHLLDCATTSEGGCGVVVCRADRYEGAAPPVWLLGGGSDRFGPSYQHPPSADLGGGRRPDLINATVGRRAAEATWQMSGLGPSHVDVCELYDPFSFEVIRQLEAFGFCGEGEGGDFVLTGALEGDGRLPVTTDGGTMSYGHSGSAQLLQRVARAATQVRGTCPTRQVPGAQVALCTGTGAGALASDVLLLGGGRP